MRSVPEIVFRVRQEIQNLRLFAFSPTLKDRSWKPRHLPSADAIARHLQDSEFTAEVDALAQRIMTGSIPLLGLELAVGSRPSWRKDYVSGLESGLSYFRRLPYLDAAIVGDHKIIWELNRHQHLVLLAMAALLTGKTGYSAECGRQLETWLADNPFLRSINWTSALEVAFRALSWIWILAWCGEQLPAALRDRLATELYRHGLYLEHNLSVYFSPNTHLLGEAVVLHLLGRVFPDWPRSAAWERLGARVVEEQIDFQMQEDGVHFEQSTYYHVYAADLFLLHRIFARRVPEAYDRKLRLGIEYLRAILGPHWQIPLIGDDDGGRLFHPYGHRERFGRATLATASCVYQDASWLRDRADYNEQATWWLGPQTPAVKSLEARLPSRLFRSSGIAVLASGDIHITFDAGPFGWAGAGHSHSDTLSLTVTAGGEEILVDAGTYTYVGDPKWRDWFRGSAAHNTIRAGGRDQATPGGPFRWLDKPAVAIEDWQTDAERDCITAVCRYGCAVHRRRVVFRKRDLRLFVYDDVETKEPVEQFWHFGERVSPVGEASWQIGSRAAFLISQHGTPDLSFGGEHGWRSRVLGRKESAYVLRVCAAGSGNTQMKAVLDLSGRLSIPSDTIEWHE
jgi:hypothetical protein